MLKSNQHIKVALADDHILLRDALAVLIKKFGNTDILFKAANGREVVETIKLSLVPDVLIMDLSMPEMDGLETATWIQKNVPSIKVLILTMYNADMLLIRLLRAGVRGFLRKDISPAELKSAIETVTVTGFYYGHLMSVRLSDLIGNKPDQEVSKKTLTDAEILFLKLSCTEMTYRDIALEMNLNERTINTLRDHIFTKLDVKSRVGVALFAIRNGLVKL